MRHHNKNRKFGRERNVRRALLRSLMFELVKHGKITTTEAKAKEIQPGIDRLVTIAKRKTVASKRLLASRLMNHQDAVRKLEKLGEGYAGRAGGYTRVMKLPVRKEDAARMARIEFV